MPASRLRPDVESRGPLGCSCEMRLPKKDVLDSTVTLLQETVNSSRQQARITGGQRTERDGFTEH